ncbi:uncharacterized protein [Amphiura filiformis]|uniref:uncharacterized protein n=1 Tax=Amphiura filiformis TaxID=82378 RepID=UPI003B21E557
MIQRYGTLDLSFNDLTTLPDRIFTSIVYIGGTLDLSHNVLTTLPNGTFISLEGLYALDLSNNNLTTLPDGIFTLLKYTQQATLDLSHNDLTTLPNRIFSEMQGLLALDLSCNYLVKLPGDIFSSMRELLTLDLSRNILASLPVDCFKTLHMLKLLRLEGNQLKIISSVTLQSLTALKVLDISKNAIAQFPSDLLYSNVNLLSLDLFHNSLETIPFIAFKNLSALNYLNISRNVLTTLPSFRALKELQVLDLSDNRLQDLTQETFQGLDHLQSLFLSNNQILELQNHIFHPIYRLTFLNISGNGIQRIGFKAFHSNLKTIDLRQNNMYKITHKSFKILNTSTTVILVDKYPPCCFIEDAQCISQEPRPEYLTCNRMLPDVSIRVSIWVIGLFALTCNGIAYYLRSQKRQANKVQTLLISQLSLSDFLIGINMLILVISDLYYNEFFPSYAFHWQQGFICKLAGFLSILSSEGSVFFITLISIDRLLAIKYTFGSCRLTTQMARICVAFAWLAAILMSGLSIGLASEEGDIFSISEVCIGIPIVRRHLTTWTNDSIQINMTHFYAKTVFDLRVVDFSGRKESILQDVIIDHKQYEQNVTYTTSDVIGSNISPINSIVIFIGVNLLCFLVVAACYIQIFRTARNTSKQAARTQTRDEEIRMARKMSALVFTDLCCWVPLCITCILAQCNLIEIPPEMYVWIIGFILPINSSINPFLYVIYGEISDYWQKRKDARNARQQIELQRR